MEVVDLLQIAEDVCYLLYDHLPTLFPIRSHLTQPPHVDLIWAISACAALYLAP